ncbi:hypothetical protein evm_004541 [Chilo suppressalis]|nr:hypothetical protein evm_004541 [Chilo suppressalis]
MPFSRPKRWRSEKLRFARKSGNCARRAGVAGVRGERGRGGVSGRANIDYSAAVSRAGHTCIASPGPCITGRTVRPISACGPVFSVRMLLRIAQPRDDGQLDKDNISQHSEESTCCARRSPSYRARAEPAPTQPPPAPDRQPSLKEKKPQLKGPRPVGSSVSDSISLSSPVACASPREDVEGPPMPASVSSLPEDHKSSLLGRLPCQRVRRKRAMLIYVCAADSQDCCAEKGALQCGAAARLRARARGRGWRVHVADLHWRSPLEQQRDHRFPVLCIAELARQSELGAVVPVLFLNSGLGTPLLPHTLECADFKAALDAAEDESDKALLNKWYSLDASTTPPCYRLVRGAPARWRREMAKTLNVLVRTLPQEACDAYLTTVVEQEVQHTVLLSVEAARRCVWVWRAGAAQEPEPADRAHHHELQRRLANMQKDLKQHLSERNIIRASIRGRSAPGGEDEYTEGVRAALGERLDALLDSLIAENEVPAGCNGIPTSLFDEINEHLSFCQKAAQCTSNREVTLNELKSYIMGDSSVPLALIGGAGCGKATLVARALCLAPSCQQDLAVIVRFVGLTSQSSSSHQLLKSIVDQCYVLHTGSVYRGRNMGVFRITMRDNDARFRCVHPMRLDAVIGCRCHLDGPKIVRAPPVGPEEAKAALAACAATYSKTGAASPPEAAVKAVQKCTLPLYAKKRKMAVLVACAATYSKTGAASPPEAAVKTVQKCTLLLYAKKGKMAVLVACAATYSKAGAASPPEAAVKAVPKCTLPLYAKVVFFYSCSCRVVSQSVLKKGKMAVLVICAATYSKTGAASPSEAAVKAVQKCSLPPYAKVVNSKSGATSPSEAAIIDVQKCTLPVFAKILAWQISLSAETFTEQSEPETAPELVICEDLEGQLIQILVTTEAALGAEKVKTCLALLTASRRGLDDTEILDMLAHDELFRSEETYLPWAPASLFWPQLAALLSPWLRWDARGAARWRDAALASAARDRYLQDGDTRARDTLAHYYQGDWYAENDPKMAGRLVSQENKFSDEW